MTCSDLAFGGEVRVCRDLNWRAPTIMLPDAQPALWPSPPPPSPAAAPPGRRLQGICRLPDGFVVFVDRALPGERLKALVVQSKKSFAKAAKLQTLHPHDAAAEPACQHLPRAGVLHSAGADAAGWAQSRRKSSSGCAHDRAH